LGGGNPPPSLADARVLIVDVLIVDVMIAIGVVIALGSPCRSGASAGVLANGRDSNRTLVDTHFWDRACLFAYVLTRRRRARSGFLFAGPLMSLCVV